MSAAFGGRVEIVKLLLERKADVKPADRVQKPAMIYAAGDGNAECVQLLLGAGVDVNARYANNVTALMWAAYGKAENVKRLLRGADVAARDDRGKTTLAIAIEQGQPEVAYLLRAAGAQE
jgi:ankyrin repeat protein